MAKTLLNVCIVGIISVLLLEVGLVFLGYGEPILYRVGGKYQYRLVPDQMKRMIGPVVQINSWGMRGSEPVSGKEKIIFYGDSITYGGNGLPDADTFVSLIEKRLSGTNYQPMNAGVNGYGPENVKELFLYHRANFEFSNVVVVVPTIDLVRPLKANGFFELYEEDDIFLSRSHLFLKILLPRLGRLLHRRFRSTTEGSPSDEMIRNRLESIVLNNIESYQSIINHSPRILIIFVPSKDENTGAAVDNGYKALFIEEFSSQNNQGVKIVDLSSSLREYGSTIYRDTVHFNSYGHKVLANLMYPYISQHFK